MTLKRDEDLWSPDASVLATLSTPVLDGAIEKVTSFDLNFKTGQLDRGPVVHFVDWDAVVDLESSLSSGERAVVEVARSLAGHGKVDLQRAFSAMDGDLRLDVLAIVVDEIRSWGR